VTGRRTWLRLVGGMALVDGRRRVAEADIGSRKARTLLAALAVENGRFVAVDRIVDVLWRTALPRRPMANVATMVSRLRSVLGAAAIVGDSRGYRLGEAVVVDLFEAARMVDAGEEWLARAQPAAALTAVRRALAILESGSVLHDQPAAEWVDRARSRQAGTLRRARLAAAEAAVRTGDVRMAQAAAEAAVANDPFDEVAYRALMSAYRAGGESVRALVAYRQLRAALVAELGVDPAPDTQRLHVTILAESTASRRGHAASPTAVGDSRCRCT
jgi:DNA-binding SARP family transcriptional activator